VVIIRLIRSSPFFFGLNDEQMAHIAKASREIEVEAGHKFFCEGEELDTFYLIEGGSVDITIGIPDRNVEHKFITIGIPDRNVEHKFVGQITRNMVMEEIAVSKVSVGDIFGWSAIIPPHESSANAIASTSCRVIAVNYSELDPVLDEDCDFAYLMAIKAAQTVRSRLRDRRIESLAFV
jgi:CRP-like cAMP-binding protein